MLKHTGARAVALAVVPRLATFLFNFIQLGLVVTVAMSLPERVIDVLILVAFELGILSDCFIRRGSMGAWVWLALCSGLGLFVSPVIFSAEFSVAARHGERSDGA